MSAPWRWRSRSSREELYFTEMRGCAFLIAASRSRIRSTNASFSANERFAVFFRRAALSFAIDAQICSGFIEELSPERLPLRKQAGVARNDLFESRSVKPVPLEELGQPDLVFRSARLQGNRGEVLCGENAHGHSLNLDRLRVGERLPEQGIMRREYLHRP